jgi:hypothetical protein
MVIKQFTSYRELPIGKLKSKSWWSFEKPEDRDQRIVLTVVGGTVFWGLIIYGVCYMFTYYGKPTFPSAKYVQGLEDKVIGNYNCIREHTCFIEHRTDIKECPEDTRLYSVLADDLAEWDVKGLMDKVAQGKSLFADVAFTTIVFRGGEQPVVGLVRRDQYLPAVRLVRRDQYLHEHLKTNIYQDKPPKRLSLPEGFLKLRGQHLFEVEVYRSAVSDKPSCPIPPTEIDVSYRGPNVHNEDFIADALVSVQGNTPYGIGLRFNWCKGSALLTSLNIERWPDQDDWDPDGLTAFIHLIDSIAPRCLK